MTYSKKASVGFTVLSSNNPDQNLVSFLDPDGRILHRRDMLVRTRQPLLVRLNLTTHDGDLIRVLCISEHIGHTGTRLILPCQLNLGPGRTLAMELFLPPSDKPMTVRGTLRKITRISNDDFVRYAFEVDFEGLSISEEKRIASYVYKSQQEDRLQMSA